MEYRILGSTGLRVSVIGFGCNRIAEPHSNQQEIITTLETAIDSGVNLLDTADSYQDGESERLLGRIFSKQRDRVLLCSKVGYRSWIRLLADKWLPALNNPLRKGGTSMRGGRKRVSLRNFSPRILEIGIENSLRRLRTDYLDLFYLHSPPEPVVADDRVFQALEKLKRKGMIRHYGISFAEKTPTDLIVAASRPELSAMQFQHNLMEGIQLARIVESSQDAGRIARQPFQRSAILSSHHWNEAVTLSLETRTPAQTILRSLTQQQEIHCVLVGMRSRDHLQENLAALKSPALSNQEMQRLYVEQRVY